MQKSSAKAIRYIDLFCGVGGFRQAMENLSREFGVATKCVFSSDINEECRETYADNFGDMPAGDITVVNEREVPDHDLLLGGFPCQPFSIIGQRRGFEDTRGTLFFDIARILKAKQPSAFVLENVRLLVNHNKGQTLSVILEAIDDLGYQCEYRVLNALDFGLPHKRERVFLVGYKAGIKFQWPAGGVTMKPLSAILETEVHAKHTASEHIRTRRMNSMERTLPFGEPMIWHENKSGHIAAKPYSYALRANASYNYLLVNGERRLTPREMFRLQGFPDTYKLHRKTRVARSQAGNSVAVPVVQAVIQATLQAHGWLDPAR